MVCDDHGKYDEAEVESLIVAFLQTNTIVGGIQYGTLLGPACLILEMRKNNANNENKLSFL